MIKAPRKPDSRPSTHFVRSGLNPRSEATRGGKSRQLKTGWLSQGSTMNSW